MIDEYLLEKDHAVLSPSKAHRWINCPPSARFELNFYEKQSEEANEGTVAHALAEYKLNKALGNKKIGEKANHILLNTIDDEMKYYTDSYVDLCLQQADLIKENCKDILVLVEEKLNFSKYVKNGFGTGDCIIVGDKELHVIDFKYGKGVVVDSKNNYQMMIYALAALDTYENLYNIKEVLMTIFQPRRENTSTFLMDVDELKKWGENVLKPRAQLAYEGEGQFNSGSWCTFCKGKTKCSQRYRDNLKLLQYDLKLPPLLSDKEIEEVLPQIHSLEKWASDVMNYVKDSAINKGKKWAGFKVVEGRSNRKYIDEKVVANLAKVNGYNDIYKTSLISLTEMEKMMGKNKFAQIMGNFIYKPKGKLTLVEESDKRPAVEITNVKEDFSQK